MAESYGQYTAMVNDTITKLEKKEGLPNIPFIRKQIKEAKKSINVIINGSVFCTDMVMLEKTEKALQDAKDRLAAFTALLDYINKKIKQANKSSK